MRDCRVCVYRSVSGVCRKWECEGTKTVSDVQKDTVNALIKKVEEAYGTDFADKVRQITENKEVVEG